MNTNGVVLHSNFLVSNGIKQQILKDGSQVLVRVIVDKGNGKYEGSVAGARINFTANRQIAPGSSFVATVNVKNGQIQLVPKNLPDVFIKDNVSLNIQNQNNLFSFMESMGLPADEFSFHLLQQFKQMELKFDSNLLNKIRNIMIKFKGKEKKASELLAVLADKKIKASDNDILQMLLELEGDFDEKDFSGQKDEKKFSLMNKVNSVKGKWYFFPFEMIFVGNNNIDDIYHNEMVNRKNTTSVLGTGSIRVLLDDNEKLKLINLLCNYNNKKYYFSLIYDSQKLNEIKINITPSPLNPNLQIEKLLKKLNKNGDMVKIMWVSEDEIYGSACGSEEFLSIEGNA